MPRAGKLCTGQLSGPVSTDATPHAAGGMIDAAATSPKKQGMAHNTGFGHVRGTTFKFNKGRNVVVVREVDTHVDPHPVHAAITRNNTWPYAGKQHAHTLPFPGHGGGLPSHSKCPPVRVVACVRVCVCVAETG